MSQAPPPSSPPCAKLKVTLPPGSIDASGDGVRAVIGDYTENRNVIVNTSRVSLHEAIELAGDEADDDAAIRSNAHFRWRFWFSAARTTRAAVIEFKNAYRISSDWNVRLLKLAGALRIKDDDTIELRVSKLLEAWGWFQTIVVGSVGVAALVVLIWKAPTAWSQVEPLLAVAICSAIASALSYLAFVEPNRILLSRRPASEPRLEGSLNA